MPIYEYACQKCKAHIEILQKITDKPLIKCQKCGGKLEKQWSQTSFQLKGSGWYVTDYAPKADAKEDKKEENKDVAKDKAASEPAPASNVDGKPSKKEKKPAVTTAPPNKE